MKPPKALIFDIDDTLVDTTPSYRGAIIETARFFGGTVCMADIAAMKAAGDANNDWVVTKDLLAAQNIEIPLDVVTEKFETLYQGTADVPGMKTLETLLIEKELLFRMGESYQMGIVTGRPKKDALDFIAQHQLSPLFEVVVTMDDGPLKPSPFPVQKALAVLKQNDAWMIGDTPDDIRSAVGAGIVAIGVIAPADDRSTARQAMLDAGASLVLENVSELEGLLF